MKALIVGLGHIGTKRARILESLGVDLVLCDSDPNVLKKLSNDSVLSKFPVYTDFKKALEHEKTDACLICTTPYSHLKLANQAAKRGVNLFIEKPLADPAFQWNDIASLVNSMQQMGRWAMMGQSYRHLRSLRGFAMSIFGRKFIAGNLWSGQHLEDWHEGESASRSYSAHIGILFESFSHSLDIVEWLLGNISSVFCSITKTEMIGKDVSDAATCLVKLTSGAVVTVHNNFIQRPRKMILQGVFEGNYREWEFDPLNGGDMLTAEMRKLVQHIERDTCPQPDLYQGIKILEWLRACEESSRQCKEMKIENVWKEFARGS